MVQGGWPGPGPVPRAGLRGAALPALASFYTHPPASVPLTAHKTPGRFHRSPGMPARELRSRARVTGPKHAPSRVQVERFLISLQPASSYIQSSAASRWAPREQTLGFQFAESLVSPPPHAALSQRLAECLSAQSPSAHFLGVTTNFPSSNVLCYYPGRRLPKLLFSAISDQGTPARKGKG